ncbi:MAG: diguanylate cyclase [Leptolyngbyaceae cyanobacterium SM1_3_5]|nr:diguanylate cyclase [Leptolyngbyaceae cyanobacterium SM1_3_5]
MRSLIISIEDVSDRTILEQKFVQSSHETNLLMQQLQRVETELRTAQARFDAFMNQSPVVAFMKNNRGQIVYVNQPLERAFNVKKSWLEGKTDFDWLPEKTARQVTQNDRAVLTAGHPIEIIETVSLDENQPRFWLSYKFPFSSGDQQFLGGVAIDITDRKQMEEALFQEKELAQVTLRSIGDAVITTNAIGEVQSLNPIAEQLTGWSQAEAQSLPLENIFQIVNELTREPIENPVEIVLRDRRIAKFSQDTLLISRSGKEVAIDNSAAPIRARDGQVVGAVLVFHDATQTRRLTRQLSWQASHDPLTGLSNRREFERRLAQAIEIARTGCDPDILCFLDLDRFKIINDTCGHAAGDELLKQIAALFQAQIRKIDVLARLGGDEFGILLHQCPLERSLRIADRLRQEVEQFRFMWGNQVFSIGVSIGVVSLQSTHSSLEQVLSAADAACYTAKHQGRNCVHLHPANCAD